MHIVKLLGLAFITCLGLTSCPFPGPTPEPEDVPFDTDPRILRGAWDGAILNYPRNGAALAVELDLKAQSLPAGTKTQEYEISGTITLGKDSPLSVLGKVTSIFETYVRPQTSYLPAVFAALNANVTDAQGANVWRLLCVRYGKAPFYQCSLNAEATSPSLNFTIQPKT